MERLADRPPASGSKKGPRDVLNERASAAAAAAPPRKKRHKLDAALRKALRDDGAGSASGDEESADEGESAQGFTSLIAKRATFRKIARETPGRLTTRTLTQYRAFVQETFGDAPEDELSPIIVRYFLSVWLPQNPIRTIGEERYRELRTWAECIDMVLRGRSVEAADMMVQRFKSCLLAVRDGHTRAARWLELLPVESSGGAVGIEEEEMVRRLEAGELKLRALATSR